MPADYPSLTKSFIEATDHHANPRAQMYRTADGWRSHSAQEMLRRVAGLSKSLAELGIQAGDRVAIFAPNCPEWHIADFAILGLGAVDVPIYFNESIEHTTYILNDSGARIVITCGETQAQKVAACRSKVPTLEHVIALSPPAGLPGEYPKFETLAASATGDDVAEYRRRAEQVAADALATIIYTSGTTGEPKGVMLSHRNISSNAHDTMHLQELTPSDVALEFLPLAHIYERTVAYQYFFLGVTIAYVERIEDVPQALLEVHPTAAAAVPRFFEKIYGNILHRGANTTGMQREIFEWALRVAAEAAPWRAYGKAVALGTKLQWLIADRLVYAKVRQGLGDHSPKFASGGAPLAPEIAEFFWSVGIPVYQGYGLTETSPVISTNYRGHNKVGTVGPAIPNVQIKIAEDGEILVKGPNVMQGYFGKPDQTQAVFTPDGWFMTGDIGRLDSEGYLTITDRKKELLKTAAGKLVAPAPIENTLKSSPFITNAIVVGDKHKFVSVLVVPNVAAIESEARKNSHEFSTPRQMVNDPWVHEFMSREIERLTANLAQYEKPKRFAMIEQDFTYASGELTYTLKLKRRIIERRYQDVIARLYADVEEPRPQHLA
jgi:long-chain acyl-CoA synthetase